MIRIIAFQYRFAEIAARDMGLQRNEWTFVHDQWSLKGLRGQEVRIVRTPRYVPTDKQLRNHGEICDALMFRDHNVLTVELA